MDNPYQAPQSELTEISNNDDLAGRWIRLVASIIDGLISMAIMFPLMYGTGLMNWEDIVAGKQPSFGLIILSFILGVGFFLLIQGYFLKQNGQTLGKKALGIRIATLDGEIPDFKGIILKRFLPIWIVSAIPLIGSFLVLIDALLIFREDRRCIHDLIAGTQVLKVTS